MRRISICIFSLMLSACTDQGPSSQPDKSGKLSDAPIKEEIYYPNGELKMSGQTVDGKKHGIWTAYFEHGGVWSRNEFQHGVQHGTTSVFHKNGLLYYTGSYMNGERAGQWNFYNEKGELERTMDYDPK